MNKTSLKKKFNRVLCTVLILCFLFTPYSFAGKSVGEYKDELTDINSELKNLTDALNSGKKESTALASEIKNLEKKIYAAEVEINTLQGQINETKQEIEDTLAVLDGLQNDIDNHNSELNARLRAMYKNGEVGMLSVLLGSNSISELMTNMDMVQRIYASDAELLSELQGQYDSVDAVKVELQALKDKLLGQQSDLQERENTLQNSKDSVYAKKQNVEKNNKELEKQIDDLNEEANRLSAIIVQLQSSGEYIGGTMLWPSESSTRITSPFGYRIHPILKVNKLHTGIDIGAAGGTNILAANAGKVISAGWNNSYGYMLMIDHGGGIVTLYAHSSKLLVSKGDIVTRGQVIAKVGTTGMSTGNHLHFEVRVNGEYKDPLNYVSTKVRK